MLVLLHLLFSAFTDHFGFLEGRENNRELPTVSRSKRKGNERKVERMDFGGGPRTSELKKSLTPKADVSSSGKHLEI